MQQYRSVRCDATEYGDAMCYHRSGASGHAGQGLLIGGSVPSCLYIMKLSSRSVSHSGRGYYI